MNNRHACGRVLALVAPMLLLMPLVSADENAPAAVVGGENAALGRWPAVAGVVIGGGVQCTGTLVAPNLVLTAGHCQDSDLSRVIIGANKLSRPGDGETIDVSDQVLEPSGLDVMLLVLASDATTPPHPIAAGWSAADIQASASAALVGFGAIDAGGNNYVDTLQQATTTISDPTCANLDLGCEVTGKELIAGGGGIDTCYGDSGGPLFLVTAYGEYLAGVTSRGAWIGQTPCGQGGIYVRADVLTNWIASLSSETLERPTMPTIAAFTAESGEATTVAIAANDPGGQAHNYEVITPPQYGTLEVSAGQLPRYTSNPGYLGADAFVVRVIDASKPTRFVDAAGAVTVVEAQSGSGCGCQSDAGAGGPTGWLIVAVAGLALLRPRRAPTVRSC
ncbi:MAG: trypsin-like serine protease [Myxococcales bacterium]|nr:trypsin-like serine protease [Myxococcales bacterium]